MPIDKIPNLWVKKEDQIVKNPPRKLIYPLDSLPPPDFELFDFSRLIATQTKTAVVIISRGCPYSCGYCCNHRIRSVYPDQEHYTRFRSPENVMLYLKKLLKLYPWVSYIRFIDNILGVNKEWLEGFCRLYKNEIGLPFACDHRADLVTPELLSLLRDAGCDFIYFGVESGDEHLRKEVLSRRMGDGQIGRAFSECRRLGIKTLAFNIIGLPYETPEKALKTIKLNAKINPDKMIANIFTPYPYTDLYETSVKEGFIPGPIADYRGEVFLDQPNFSKEEVLFLATLFRPLAQLYQKTRRCPPFWRLLDAAVLSPRLPRRALIALVRSWYGIVEQGKGVVRKRLPKVYIFLRDRIYPVFGDGSSLRLF